MSASNGSNGGNTPKPGPDNNQAPQVNVVGQYIKDLSFECPDATRFFRGPGKNPNLQINFNVQVRNLQQDAYEVALSLEGEAKSDEGVLYNIELVYAGAFVLRESSSRSNPAGPLYRVPGAFVPVRQTPRRRSFARGRVPAAASRPDRLCGPLSAPRRDGAGADNRHGVARRFYHNDRFAWSAWMRVISDDIQDRMTASASMGRMPW